MFLDKCRFLRVCVCVNKLEVTQDKRIKERDEMTQIWLMYLNHTVNYVVSPALCLHTHKITDK